MEEVRTTQLSNNNNNNERRQGMSVMTRMKKDCLSFTTSFQQGFRYFKAFLVGQAKKMTARNEEEASEADLQTAKMQVEATDAAEDTKKRLHLVK